MPVLTGALRRRPTGGAAALALASVLVCSGCGADRQTDPASAPASSGPSILAPSPGGEAEQGSCPEVIPAEVLVELGWTADGAPEEGLGGCEWVVEEGLVAIATEADGFQAECAQLEQAAAEQGFDYVAEVDHLAAPLRGCASRPPADLGMSTLVVEVDGTVASARIAAREPTDPAAVARAQQALAARTGEL